LGEALYTEYEQSKKFNDFIEGIFTELETASGGIDKRSEFRSSSFPYCPILDLENRISGIIGFEEGYRSGFYTGIGTAVHENVQKWLPRLEKYKDNLWGDWVCSGCGQKDNNGEWRRQYHGCLQPEPCNCDKKHKHFVYLEYTIDKGELDKFGNPAPLSIHVDLIFLINKKLWVDDLKTTGYEKISKPDWKKTYPALKYATQISNYCVIIERFAKYKVAGWGITYVARDKTNFSTGRRGPMIRTVSNVWDDAERELWEARLDKAAKGRKNVVKLLDTGRVKYAENIVKLRPCSNKKEYKDWMKAHFYGRNECPHFESGRCPGGKMPGVMVDRVEYLASAIEAERRGIENPVKDDGEAVAKKLKKSKSSNKKKKSRVSGKKSWAGETREKPRKQKSSRRRKKSR